MDPRLLAHLAVSNAVAAYAACWAVVVEFLFLIELDDNSIPREPSLYRDTLRTAFMDRIFHGGPRNCIDYLRMDARVFYRLVHIFRERNLLKDTIHVSIEEQVAMFLHIVGHNTKNRVLRIDFIRSGKTISQYFNAVLCAIAGIKDLYMRQPAPGDPVPDEISSTTSYYPWFKDCIGLIDGTHIKIIVPADLEARFTGRKGVTQNVLAAATPNKQFTYVLAGWEGSTNDFTVLRDALSRVPPDGLRTIPGKYYLCDAGYTTMPGFIAPYRSMSRPPWQWPRQPDLPFSALFPEDTIPMNSPAFQTLVARHTSMLSSESGNNSSRKDSIGHVSAGGGSVTPATTSDEPAISSPVKRMKRCAIRSRSGSPSAKRSGTPNKRWSKEESAYALEVLAEQAALGNKIHKTFKRSAFVAAAEAVNVKFERNFDAQNVDNHLKGVKAKWKEIQSCKLLSGAGWNDDLKMIELEPETYKTYVAAHPERAAYINKPIPDYEILRTVCGDDHATGSFASSGIRTKPPVCGDDS